MVRVSIVVILFIFKAFPSYSQLSEIFESKKLYLNRLFDDSTFSNYNSDSLLIISNSMQLMKKRTSQDCFYIISLKINQFSSYAINCESGQSGVGIMPTRVKPLYVFNQQCLGVEIRKRKILIFKLDKIIRESDEVVYVFKR